MSYHVVGMILVYLRMAASEEGIQIQQSPAQLWLTSGQTAHLDCRISEEEWRVRWYKEQQNGSLHGIHQSSESESLDGKYSSKVNITANMFALLISNVQREDSGVYYCGLSASVYLQPNFGTGTRLIVTDGSEPRLSILVPSTQEDAELPPIIPLLCLLSDFTPPWSEVLWDTGEEASEGQTDAGAIDGKGVFSVWSLTTIPSETWKQETICTCTAKESSEGRSISATVSKETGNCMIVFYAGLPCIFILLLIQLLILLWRKCPIRGRAVQRGNQIPMRQMPQTEYATLMYSNRNAPR
ncbi:immunoglobulin gamma-1 heavy chain-like isoform X2 [Trachemys scripta elegans]|uniref:immunoglobulin gamma-1 heavy chain-like isoform X2 n=1 Tax=Trachemys scripta elegans TaxID=31138 RepID=UPI00155700B5|nr:immunoglobulin gamma-1 heavy chain-like isoform X2 [Trachemys scripta elegans]